MNPKMGYIPQTHLEKKALLLATKYHADQFRKSGEPYITHCIQTAQILTEWGVTDEVLLAAALSHDLLEDTPLTAEELIKELGKEVCQLVEGVTKFKKTTGEGDNFATKRKIAAESYLDPRVAILKLADRLHNMSTLSFVSPEKQIIKAEETLLLYAPLAESLGMWQIKRELEDLSFSFLAPVVFKHLKEEITSDIRMKSDFLSHYTDQIETTLSKYKLSSQIEIRRNGIWTLKKKRERAAFSQTITRNGFSHINDLVSIRVICSSRKDCYLALSYIHELFSPIVNASRFDEYIVSPRMNGYSALQTTLETPEGSLEIAIATKEMEQFNNWGVVTVLKKGNGLLAAYTRKAVFTLNERVWYLPREATALDLAYTINPALGRSARFAVVNGKKMSLDVDIPNAATVVFTVGKERSKYKTHSLDSVHLPQSRELISDEKAHEEWEAIARLGRRMVSRLLLSQHRGIFDLAQIDRNQLLDLFFTNGCKSLPEFYYRIGMGNVVISIVEGYLDQIGFGKDNPLQRGILIQGTKEQDKPGILADTTRFIARQKGNILYVENSHTKSQQFKTILLVSGLTQDKTEVLKKKLTEDNRFAKVLFV